MVRNYENLPGVNIDVKDGQLLQTLDNTSNSILIIAEAKAPKSVNIPEEPMLVLNEVVLRENFGGFFYQGEVNPIAAEWAVAKQEGVRNVYLLATQGNDQKARFVYLQDMLFNVIPDLQLSHVVLSDMYADEDIEGLTAEDFGVDSLDEISGVDAYFTFRGTQDASNISLPTSGEEGNESPEAVTLTVTFGDNQEFSVTVDENMSAPALIAHLNKEARAALSELGYDLAFNAFLDDGKAVIQSSVEVALDGTEVLSALGLEGQDSALEGYGNAGALLGHYTTLVNSEGSEVIAYIPTKPVRSTNLSEIKQQVDSLVARNNDISKNVQVVAGPPVGVNLPGSLRTQWLSGVTQYAVLVNQLAPQNATTNSTLPGVNTLRYELSLNQLNRLVGNKYVTFRSKNNAIVVVDGITTAPDLYVGQDVVRSDYSRLSTLRISNYMVSRMRQAMDAFIGTPNEFTSYSQMNTAIKAVIKDAISAGVIMDATYQIRMDGTRLDTALVDLTILPQFELREINLTVGMSTPEGFQAAQAEYAINAQGETNQ